MSSAVLPRLIAVTGQEGCGKDTYADHLATQGYLHISAGGFLRGIARNQGMRDPIPRTALSRIGDELKAKYGPSPITEASLAQLHEHAALYPAGLVISGLRRVGEIENFKRRGARVLWIAANEETRYRNLGYRSEPRPNWETFLAQSDAEYYGDTAGGKEGVNLKAVEALADARITNDLDVPHLYDSGDSALKSLAN